MPVAPYASVLVSVNGGAPHRGGVEATFGDTVQLYAESTIGWGIPAAVWEITTYPAGWPPPSGWSVDPTTKAYVVLGNLSSLPAFQLPAAGTGQWGKWKFRLRVNGGGGALTDWSTAVEIVSPHGVHDLATSEGSEFGAERGWPGDQQKNLRLLDQAVAGAGSTLASISVTPPLESTGPANAPVLGIPLVTDSADGAMLHQDKARLDAATPNATPGTLVARDSLGSSAFQVVSVQTWLTFAQAGSFLISQAQAATGAGAQASICAQQGAAGQSGGPLLLGGGDAGTPGAANTWAGSTLVQLGQLDAATHSSAALQLLAGATGAFLSIVCTGGAAVLTVTTGITLAVGTVNLALTPAGLALTVPLVQVANAPAPPASSPPSGVYLYVDAGAWKARSAAGVITTMAPTGTAGATVTLLDWIAGDCTTSTTQAQLLLTYTVPANALVELDAVIQARNPANGNGSWFRRVVRVKRGPGSPGNAVLKSTTTPVPDDDENGCIIAVEVKLFSVYLLITGPVGLVCFGSARVQVFAP